MELCKMNGNIKCLMTNSIKQTEPKNRESLQVGLYNTPTIFVNFEHLNYASTEE